MIPKFLNKANPTGAEPVPQNALLNDTQNLTVSVQPGTDGKRPEARSWLTYPEWYIVYSADSYARYLKAGGRPSGFAYGREIKGFWTGLCAVNRVADPKDTADAKVMLYTIGLSFSVEMAVKSTACTVRAFIRKIHCSLLPILLPTLISI